MTSEHIFPLLRNPRDGELLCQLATEVARAELPADIVKVIRMGRMTALKKPQGGVRGIVVGDIMRRLVARTMARALGTKFQDATARISTLSPPSLDVSRWLM